MHQIQDGRARRLHFSMLVPSSLKFPKCLFIKFYGTSAVTAIDSVPDQSCKPCVLVRARVKHFLAQAYKRIKLIFNVTISVHDDSIAAPSENVASKIMQLEIT